MAEWASNRSYAVRVANLMGQPGSSFAKRLNGNYFLKTNGPNITVFDDGQSDKLTGSSGRDWFFADLDGGTRDTITDRKCDERVDDVDA